MVEYSRSHAGDCRLENSCVMATRSSGSSQRHYGVLYPNSYRLRADTRLGGCAGGSNRRGRLADGWSRALQREDMRTATISGSNSVATPENPVSDTVSKSLEVWNLTKGSVLAIRGEYSSQPHDNVVAMRNYKSLPCTLWRALHYDAKAHAFALLITRTKKSNLDINSQVEVLPIRAVILQTWYRLATDTISILGLRIRDKVLSFPKMSTPVHCLKRVTPRSGKGMDM